MDIPEPLSLKQHAVQDACTAMDFVTVSRVAMMKADVVELTVAARVTGVLAAETELMAQGVGIAATAVNVIVIVVTDLGTVWTVAAAIVVVWTVEGVTAAVVFVQSCSTRMKG